MIAWKSWLRSFRWDRSRQKRLTYRLIHMWNIPILIMAFLLGRATILETVSPFAVAFLAVMFHLGRKQWPLVMIALLTGAASLSAMQLAKLFGLLMILIGLHKLFTWFGKGTINHMPLIVLFTGIVGYLCSLWWSPMTYYDLLLASAEVLLSFILTFIFVQSLPIFTLRKKQLGLKHEELICLVILVGSVMTGMLGWEIGGVAVVNIIARYIILTLALVGGGMLGASMGLVTGLILNLSDPEAIWQISLLAFAGLLAGLFKEGNRLGISIGFLLGSTLLTLYTGTAHIWISIEETLIAIGLFFLTPVPFFRTLSRYIPGTFENQYAHQEYVRRLRDATAAKVERFTELFYELSGSFREDMSKQSKEDESQVQQFITNTMEQSCLGCRRFQDCWEKKVVSTYQGMTHLMTLVESSGTKRPIPVPAFWNKHCVKPDQVMASLQDQYAYHEQSVFWRDRMKESRQLVSEQLTGMAEVMERLSEEIRHETQVLSTQEDHIHTALEDLGLSIQRVDVMNLEEGKVEIEVTMPHPDAFDECRKLVAPLLTEIVGEPISVYRKMIQDGSSGAVITLGSAQRFEMNTGVATAAKGGGFISGDSYCTMSLGTGKYAIAISDGMGNGPRAQEESSAALKLIRRLLYAGMNEDRAIETINSILSLRSVDEIFATIDLAMIDLNSAQGRFMKIGSTPGFIKRGKKVIKITAANPPVGILHEIDVESIEMQLQPGDLLILMTDGIYDAPRHVMNKDTFMTRIISEVTTKDPQDFADCLLEQVVRYHQGQIEDDMMVVVSKVERTRPEWSTISLPGVQPLKKPQTAV